MNEPRTIKKYPNRRLYDTVESRYITLDDIRALVLERVDFVVIDKKTQGRARSPGGHAKMRPIRASGRSGIVTESLTARAMARDSERPL